MLSTSSTSYDKYRMDTIHPPHHPPPQLIASSLTRDHSLSRAATWRKIYCSNFNKSLKHIFLLIHFLQKVQRTCSPWHKIYWDIFCWCINFLVRGPKNILTLTNLLKSFFISDSQNGFCAVTSILSLVSVDFLSKIALSSKLSLVDQILSQI